ncbi:MAG: hypothetical protein NVS3B21_16100 [Acidimicrobiales bacterium]
MQSLLILLLPLALYMLVLRPQRQRVRVQRSLLAELAPGDEVVTAGGMIGTLVSRGDDRARVEFAPGVVIDFLPPAIVRRLTPTDAPPPLPEGPDGLGHEEN